MEPFHYDGDTISDVTVRITLYIILNLELFFQDHASMPVTRERLKSSYLFLMYECSNQPFVSAAKWIWTT